jgi:hypothetical protein
MALVSAVASASTVLASTVVQAFHAILFHPTSVIAPDERELEPWTLGGSVAANVGQGAWLTH